MAVPTQQEVEQLGGPPALDSMGIDMESLLQEFRISQEYIERYTNDFVQLDNLVDGVPVVREDKAPFVGDTTLAGLVRSIPRSSLKQLPVLSTVINGSKNSITALLCNFLLRKTAFNEDTFGKGLLSTLQIGAEQALTHGFAAFLVATGQMYNDFGTSMRLLHYSDTGLEPGVSDSNESGYHFVVAHLTPGKVKSILRKAEAKESTTWNIPALKKLLESTPTSKNYSKYQSDPKKVGGPDNAHSYELITRYETGPNGKTVTFCKEVTEAPLRVLEGKSKWGYPRVQYLVIDPAALTPFGISRVRLAAPNQNFMNIYYGNIAAMLLLNSAPPLFKRGTFLKPTALKRNAVWESMDPNAEISLKMLDNGSLGSFPTISAQLASQIQNIMGGQSNMINGGSKASPFGKTAPGVQAGQDLMGVETNQITNILENFLRQYGLVSLDVLLSENSGEDTIIVDDDTMNAINTVAEQEFLKTAQKDPITQMPLEQFVPVIGDDHEIKIVWEDLYASIKEWSVEIDVSLSPDELKDAKHADLQDMLVVLAQNAKDIPGAAEKVQEITGMLMQDKTPLLKPMAPAIMPTVMPSTGQVPGAEAMPPQGM